MNKIKLTLLITGIVAIVLFFSIWAFLLQKETDDITAPEIYESLVLPYSKAIISGDLDFAYNVFTTKKYKAKHSLKEFKDAQKANVEFYGKLDSMNLTTGIFVFSKDIDRLWVYRGTINYFARKQPTKFSIDAVKEDGKFRISQTYPSQLTIRASSPQIF